MAHIALLAILMSSSLLAQEPGRYVGRSVAAVLQELQAAKLPIIFSSDLITPDLRVKSEPTSVEPREIALRVLEPHGLTLREGPRGTLLVVKAARSDQAKPRNRSQPATTAPAREPSAKSPDVEPARIEEKVDVIERVKQHTIGSSVYSVGPSTIRETAGGFENVFQVLPLFPGITAINDDEGKLAVRGAGPEHNMVVLDGVQIHNPYQPEIRAVLDSLRAADDEPDVSLDRSGVAALVQRVLDHLPPRYAEVLECKYIDEMPVHDIGVRLGVGTKAAESLLTRAWRTFREAFDAIAPMWLGPGIRRDEERP